MRPRTTGANAVKRKRPERSCVYAVGTMRRAEDFFGEAELDLIYLAKRLKEALRLEALLTEAGIDYLVETGTYTGGFLLKRDLTGAFFYVAPANLVQAREILVKNRYRPYEPDATD